MTRRTSGGPTAERLVDAALGLIAERGGSRGVNLREVSRRVGCAHTNVYNYFSSIEELRWAAFRKGLVIYADAIAAGLHDARTPRDAFRRLIGNLAGFALENPGLNRFIGSDPVEPEAIPEDVIDTVTTMKRYYVEVLQTLCAGRVDPSDVEEMGNILLSYVDGEVFNLINGRVLPGEDVAGRVVDNAERLFTLLTATTSDGIVLSRETVDGDDLGLPSLEVSS